MSALRVDLYGVLGLGADASASEIKREYRALARKLHPDKNQGARSERFLLVQVAYEVLSDSIRKKQYDFGRARRWDGGRPGRRASSAEGTTYSNHRRPERNVNVGSYKAWKEDLKSTREKLDSDAEQFEEWKRMLYSELDATEGVLRKMAPSPQKVQLLRSMIDRVESIRSETACHNDFAMTAANSCDTRLKCRANQNSKDRTSVHSASSLTIQKSDKERERLKEKEKPGEDFLAFLAAKKKKHADRRK